MSFLQWYHAIPDIVDRIMKAKPKSVLEIGTGFGRLGPLLRELLEKEDSRFQPDQWRIRMDLVTIDHSPWDVHVYQQVYEGEIGQWLDRLSRYDVILFNGGLEQWSKEDGQKIIRRLLQRTNRTMMVTIPTFPLSARSARWSPIDFIDYETAFEEVGAGENGIQIIQFATRKKQSQVSQILQRLDRTLAAKPRVFRRMPLKIAYVLPEHRILIGGMIALFEHIRLMRERGHHIVALYRGEKRETVFPDWWKVKVDKEVLVPKGNSFIRYLKDVDVVVAGWLPHLPELCSQHIPVLYWELGNEQIFGENRDVDWDLSMYYQQPCFIVSVSTTVQRILEKRFHRQTPVIPHGIDTSIFSPGTPPDDNVILMVGNPIYRFKGLDVGLRTLEKVWHQGHRFSLKWVCHQKPQFRQTPPFPLELIVNPSQQELPTLYKQADLFLFTSWYEGFGIPPLEAMASGLPVVLTRCGGIETFATTDNAIMAEPGNVDELADGVIRLLTDAELRQSYGQKGRETAERFSRDQVGEEWERVMYTVANSRNRHPF